MERLESGGWRILVRLLRWPVVVSSGIRPGFVPTSRRSSGHLSGSLSGHRCGLRTRLVVIVVDCGRCLRLFDVRCLRLFDAPATLLQNFVLCFMCRSSALL